MDKEVLVDKFTKYVNLFNMSDDGISRKYYHSLRVMDKAVNIAKAEKLDKENIELSMIIGLLHDYARFTQWRDYNTYSDLRSIDHGDLAVELLFENKEIEYFNVDKSYYEIMYNAIKYHNKLSIPNNLEEDICLHSKIIRDADKLDILYLYGVDKKLFLEDNFEISEKVRNDFFNHKEVSRNDLKSRNDKIILDLALVYDFNFNYSFKYIKDNKMIDKLYYRIKNKELFKEYFDYIKKYIDERIG